MCIRSASSPSTVLCAFHTIQPSSLTLRLPGTLPVVRRQTARGGAVVAEHACDRQTDRRTDGKNYDSQDRASIAASRGKKSGVQGILTYCAVFFRTELLIDGTRWLYCVECPQYSTRRRSASDTHRSGRLCYVKQACNY